MNCYLIHFPFIACIFLATSCNSQETTGDHSRTKPPATGANKPPARFTEGTDYLVFDRVRISKEPRAYRQNTDHGRSNGCYRKSRD